MSKYSHLKDGVYTGYLTYNNDCLTQVKVKIDKGQICFFDSRETGRVEAPKQKVEKQKVEKQEAAPTEGDVINWLFVFAVGFTAIAAFHLFVK